MLKDFTWSRFLGRVVIEHLPKICAGLIVGYLLIAQPWKTHAPAGAPGATASAQVGEQSGAASAQRIAEAHTAPLELPTARPALVPEEPEAVPPPPPSPAPRNRVKERQFQAAAKAPAVPATAADSANPQPAPAVATRPANEPYASADRGKAEASSWSDKVVSLGGSALEATKRGSARVIEMPVTAYEYSRDAVGKAASAVASILPFGR